MSAERLSPIERAVLEFFGNHDIIINPSSLAENIGYDRNYTARTCDELAKRGLLEKLEGPKYQLSDEGRTFVRDGLDSGG